MMNFPKQITSEFFEYTTNVSLDELKASVNNLIDNKNGIGFSNSLSGKLTKENEFKITPKWEIGPLVTGPLGYFNNNTPTNIKMFIYSNKNHVTRVNLLVSPNSYYPSLFVLFPIALIALLLMYRNTPRVSEAYLIIIPLLFLCPIIILTMSAFFKNRLKGKLAKYLDLKQLE